MGHIQDRWYKEVVDPETSGKALRVPTALHGAGLRYKVRYIDPDGQERSKSYPDKKLKDARAFLAKVETDKLTGDYIDPAAGKTTLREYCDNWLKGQSQDESSQRTMRFKLEIQVYPSLGTRSLSTIECGHNPRLAELDERERYFRVTQVASVRPVVGGFVRSRGREEDPDESV